tara:strand:+ start:584 stop:904 length:321 start_codon:yes stop_codon:yes gene_type:complete
MKTNFRWSFREHLVVVLVISIASFIIDLTVNKGFGSGMLTLLVKGHSFLMNQNAASIGIIGGADGPTSFFVTGDALAFMLISNFILFIILAMLFRLMKYLIEKKLR